MRSLLKDGYRILCDDLFGIRGAQRTPLLTKRAFEEVYTQHAKERPPQCEPPAFTKETHAEETAQHVDVVGFVSILTSIAQSWRRTVGQPLGPLGLAALLSQIVASGEQTWGWEARLAERQINRVRTPWTGRPKLNIWDMLLEDEEEEGGVLRRRHQSRRLQRRGRRRYNSLLRRRLLIQPTRPLRWFERSRRRRRWSRTSCRKPRRCARHQRQ